MRILYISRSIFPYGAAYASRVLNFSKMLHDMGHIVHVITDYTLDEEAKKGGIINLDFCSYQTVCKGSSIKERMLLKQARYRCVKEYLDKNQVDYIITCSFSQDYRKMRRLMTERGIPYAIEVCEWLDISAFKFGKLDIRYLKNEITLKRRYLKEGKIIAISRYLQNYYEPYPVSCIRIPTILELEDYGYATSTGNDKCRIMYAGNPGKSKELLKSIFEAIRELKEEDKNLSLKMCLDIYGVNEGQVLYNIDKDKMLLKSIYDCVEIHGKVKQESMNEIYQQHDFSIFMRPHRKSSEAGFPTKLAESFAAGTPVIANDTGDIACHIRNGENGFLVENEAKELKRVFYDILMLDERKNVQMRENARMEAEHSFDYKVYEEEMRKFIYE